MKFKTLTDFLENTTHRMDVYDMEKCIATLHDSEGEEIASIDFVNSAEKCDPKIWIDEVPVILSEKEKERILNHLDKVSKDDLSQWNENKNDKYNVRDDQN